MITVKLTKDELHMLREACNEFELPFNDGWKYSGYEKSEIKDYYNAINKLFNTPQPNISEIW